MLQFFNVSFHSSASETGDSQLTNLVEYTLKINHHNPLMHFLCYHLQRLMRLALIIVILHVLLRSKDREYGYRIALGALVWEGVSRAYG
jgi:hypothetical protein